MFESRTWEKVKKKKMKRKENHSYLIQQQKKAKRAAFVHSFLEKDKESDIRFSKTHISVTRTHTRTPEEGFSREPDLVLLHSFPGEEEEQQQHGDGERRCTPTTQHGTQPVQPMRHQNAVTHTGERERQECERTQDY